MGTGDFTIEAWVFITGNGALDSSSERPVAVFSNLVGSSGNGFNIEITGNSSTTGTGLRFATRQGASQIFLTYTGTITQNAWHHVAVSRTGTTTYLFLDGIQVASTTLSNQTVSSTQPFLIGYQNITGYTHAFLGYISNFRLIKGTGLYTSSFTPSTTPLTAISGTQLLLNYTNAGIYDATTLNNMETVGNAQVSTAQAKWSAGSVLFDGSGDNLSMPKSSPLDMGSGNFTLEWWMYPTTTSQNANACIISSGNATWGTGAVVIDCGGNASNKVRFVTNPNGAAVVDPNAWTVNTWTYFAFVRNGNTLTLYRNGTSVASNTSMNTWQNTINFNFNNATKIGGGNWDGAGSYFTGYIEDLRVTKGIARYTSNFTAPTAPFPTR